jgi:hypothetical protein
MAAFSAIFYKSQTGSGWRFIHGTLGCARK